MGEFHPEPRDEPVISADDTAQERLTALKTLVTGGSGFVGNHLVRRLLDEGVQVRVMARRPQDCSALHHLPWSWWPEIFATVTA